MKTKISKEVAAEKSKKLASAGASKLKGGANGFMEFIREQNIVGVAVGMILALKAGELVKALVNGIITPLLGLILGSASNLSDATIMVGGAVLSYGNLISTMIDFIVVAFVLYVVIKLLKLDVKK